MENNKTNHCTASGDCQGDNDGCYHRKYIPLMRGCLFRIGDQDSKKCISPFALLEAQSADQEIVDAVCSFCGLDGCCSADKAQEKLCAHNPQAPKGLCPHRAWCDVCCSAQARKAVHTAVASTPVVSSEVPA